MRTFLPEDLSINNWAQIETYFEDLNTRAIDSVEDLKKWMHDRSELEAVLEENMAWRYIKMNIDTTDPELQKSFQFFVQNISPKITSYAHGLNIKLINSKHLNDLDSAYYFIYLRDIKNAIHLYREENIPLFTELTNKAQKFGEISAQMMVQVDGKDQTLQQASVHLKSIDTDKRKAVFELINERRTEDQTSLDVLLDDIDENMSNKFKKHDLIGIPYQIIVGSKTTKDKFEFKEVGKEPQVLEINKIINLLKK